MINVSQPAHLILFSAGNQMLQGAKGQVIAGNPGTVVSRNKQCIILHTGRVTISAGNAPAEVQTRLGSVSLNPQAKIIIDEHADKTIHVSVLASDGEAGTLRAGKTEESMAMRSGDELILSETALEEDVLIPADGVTQCTVPGGIVKRQQVVDARVIESTQTRTPGKARAGKYVHLGTTVRSSGVGGLLPVSDVRSAQNLGVNIWEGSAAGSGEKGRSEAPIQVVALAGTRFNQASGSEFNLASGTIFLPAKKDSQINTAQGQIKIRRSGIVVVEASQDSCRVKALSGPDDVQIVLKDEVIKVTPGEEVLLSETRPSNRELNPADGIARRIRTTRALDEHRYVSVNDFSLISLLHFPGNLPMIKSLDQDNKLVDKLIKTVAVVEMVTQSHGKYVFAENTALPEKTVLSSAK